MDLLAVCSLTDWLRQKGNTMAKQDATPDGYESFIRDLMDSINEMRDAGGYDENTLETLEWRFSAPTEQENN